MRVDGLGRRVRMAWQSSRKGIRSLAHAAATLEDEVTKEAEQNRAREDTFIVVERAEGFRSSQMREASHSMRMPGGQTVHAIDKKVFDRAVRAAMSPNKKK